MSIVRAIRKKANLTQEQLAIAAEVERSTVSDAERSDPRLSTICKYATAAGVRTLTIDLTKEWPDYIDVRMKRGQS